MVTNSSIICMIISAVICFALPIGLGIYFYRKEKISLAAVVCGILMFTISQIVLRIPILKYLNGQKWFVTGIQSNFIIYALFLGLTAGIFEEVARFIGFKYILKNKLNWKNGIAFGIGHGGIEAIILVGISYISNIGMAFLINAGTFDSLVVSKVPQAEVLKQTLINTPSHMFFIGGIERIFAILLHMALTMIVLEGVMKKQNKYLFYAILIHGLVDFVAAYVGNILGNMYVTEGIMFVVAAICFKFLLKSRNRFESIKIDNSLEV